MNTLEKGICGICGRTGPLTEIQEHFLNVHTELENTEEMQPLEKEQEAKSGNEQIRWASESVLLLIRLVEKHYSSFDNGLKKNVWLKITNELCTICGKQFTHDQVENKWKGLKKTYKKINDHNNSSGNDRKSWEYFHVMDQFMSKRHEIIPPATCSSADGLKINQVSITENVCSNPIPSTSQQDESQTSSFMKKRKLRENAAESRHKDKMLRYDKFLELFQLSVEHQIGKKINQENQE